MEETLKSINTMQGVSGSLIFDGKGKILAAAMPGASDKSMLENVGRIISQTLGGLAAIHRRRVGDIDLVFRQGRFIVKNLGESYLGISCVRSINTSLLDLSVGGVAKKLMEKLEDTGKEVIQESGKLMESASRSLILSDEVSSIISTARERGIILQAAGDTAISLHCPSATHTATPSESKILLLAGHEKQTAQIIQVLGDLGYSRERAFNVLRGSQRLRFTHPQKQFELEVFLDVLKMRCQLDFSESLNLYDDTLPLADLLLWKLQTTPFDEQTTRNVYAILNDHELGGPGESEKIDTLRIITLCTSDWGWYKAVTVNLEKSIDWVRKVVGEDAVVFLERASRLFQMIKDAPKSDGWQLRGLFDEEPLI